MTTELAAYEAASLAARRAAEAGAFEEALRWFDAASDAARALDDERLLDLAAARRASILIEDGRGRNEVAKLRELLMRNVDVAVCRYAAYNLARWYELQREFAKALFYARVAREQAVNAGDAEWLAASHNQVGNVLLAQSRVPEAGAEYETALELMPRDPTPALARVLDNLGYCRVLAGRLRDGFALLYASLRILRRAGAERYSISTRLDLCYAHIEAERYVEAHRHGETALALAREHGDNEAVKNAYFLLGEAANLNSDTAAAQAYFTRLQREYFPTQTYLPSFLLAVDVRKLVNLHA
jgi:tetratricopeptide (TPR) repeat protein